VVTAAQLAARRAEVARSRDLTALLAHLTDRAAPLLAQAPHIPEEKALLSSDGGVCPDDGVPLTFDPWSPCVHRCPRCGKTFSGERHDRHWARYQHLWLADRAAHLATLAALDGNDAAGARAAEILRAYAQTYLRYPNRDNVLGPSRLFFSTYLESLWICNYLAAAVLLRECGRLDEAGARGVTQVADEAANLIGEYDERFSNRQTWNDAALAAIAAWFEDEGLAARAIEGPAGLLPHLLRGFGGDGMWYEGENYHLFALRGLLTGATWARQAGVDLYAEPPLAERVAAALLAPARSALPDFTFPARKDARFGVSLAQPMYLELWEIGLAELGRAEQGVGKGELESWLAALYRAPAPTRELFESYLHDAPIDPRPAPVSRSGLSWWALLFMAPALSSDPAPWSPASVLLQSQGLAVLRARDRYVSLECGPYGGGHGHPDRLHLTVHANGVHWLPDPGTGSYVTRDLFWYRSTLAHNAPRLDGASQPAGDASCDAFDAPGEWAWTRGRYGDVTRTVVSGPEYVLDVVELASPGEHRIELPWHFQGTGDAERGTWTAAELADEFVSCVERFVPHGAGPVTLELAARGGGGVLKALLLFEGELVRAEGPGLPGSGRREPFYLVRASGRSARFVTVLEPGADAPLVRGVEARGGVITIDTTRGSHRHVAAGAGWEITTAAGTVRLGGARDPEAPFEPLLELDRPTPAVGAALRTSERPRLDGSTDGFDTSEPLRLELEDQYRRSEQAYSGPEDFSALAYAGWDDDALYLAVEVTKPDLCFRPAAAPPLRLDNEPDDVHSDGLQLYLRDLETGAATGFLVVPEDGGALRVRGAGDAPGALGAVEGAWQRTPAGYRVTLAVTWPEWHRAHVGGRVGFDLIVNEMLPDRVRRAGQLVWSGGDGWVWLRGDQQDPERMGILELVG
jgi:heparinase II/III-like protein/alginate lyase